MARPKRISSDKGSHKIKKKHIFYKIKKCRPAELLKRRANLIMRRRSSPVTRTVSCGGHVVIWGDSGRYGGSGAGHTALWGGRDCAAWSGAGLSWWLVVRVHFYHNHLLLLFGPLKSGLVISYWFVNFALILVNINQRMYSGNDYFKKSFLRTNLVGDNSYRLRLVCCSSTLRFSSWGLRFSSRGLRFSHLVIHLGLSLCFLLILLSFLELFCLLSVVLSNRQ